ncbi:hypothetical protein ALC62_08594 [Cyphomyrmex costatus]|uniref:Uncharacterized protein n=1 Tax=Cyphomyrmex costatus TaxID=456900 RepID=A0A151IGT0_9HYME|nr:hypothetical protein ALC62_08594 [Cyphomyrmex costatus]
MQNRPAARLQQGRVSLVQIRQPVGPGPNILEEASETGDTNCDVTARVSWPRHASPTLCNAERSVFRLAKK